MRYLVLALALLATPVQAGSLQFTLVQGGFANATRTYTIADADITRIISAFQASADAERLANNLSVPATRAQVLNHWMMRFILATQDKVKRVERDAQVNALPPIVPPDAQ